MTKEQYEKLIESIIKSPRNDLQKIGMLKQGFELYVEENVPSMDCEYCQHEFKHCGKYYISTGYANDPYLYTLRKEDSVGGVMIKYCPWCGRELDQYC